MPPTRENQIAARKIARLQDLVNIHGLESAEVRAWRRLYPELEPEAKKVLERNK